MEPPPIVFGMNVHCRKCAKFIRRSLKESFGASVVEAYPKVDVVVVHGGKHLDPWTLKCFLQRLGEKGGSRHGAAAFTSGRGVTTLSDGGRPQRSHFQGIEYVGPKPPAPAPYPYYYQPPPPPPPPSYYGGGPRWY